MQGPSGGGAGYAGARGLGSGADLAGDFGHLLAQGGVDKKSVTAFALAFLVYNLKVFWAPLVDRVPLPHPEVLSALAPGVQLLLDDGKLRLEVEEAGADFAVARVLVDRLPRASTRAGAPRRKLRRPGAGWGVSSCLKACMAGFLRDSSGSARLTQWRKFSMSSCSFFKV